MARSVRKPLLLTLLLLGLLLAMAMGVRSCGAKPAVGRHAGPAETMPVEGVTNGSETFSGRDARPPGGESAVAGTAPMADMAGDGRSPRLTAVTFVMDRSGLKVAGVLTAPGRAKAPPTSVAPHQLEFTLQDASGNVVYQGALDHPLRRVEEYEDPARPGEFKRLPRELDSEAFQLRFPAGLGARTVTLVERVTVDGQFRRTSLGTFPIP